jgi:hypothetical protein
LTLIEAIIQGIEKADSIDPTDVILALEEMAENGEPLHLPIGDATGKVLPDMVA